MTRITLLIPLLALLLSCGQVTQPDNGLQTNAAAQVSTNVGGSQPAAQPSVAQPPPMVAAPPSPPVAAAPPPPVTGDLLLEEKIIIYNTIVLATLASTSSEVVLASDPYRGGVDNRYRAILKFNLTVHEYLKGSGPTNITALWLDGTYYATSAEAESARAAIVQRRDTQWDDERAIVLLVGNHRGSVGIFGTALSELLHRSNHFFLGSRDRYSGDDRYSLHSGSSVVWFPEQGSSTLADGSCMMTLPPNSQNISLPTLKQTIEAVTAELAQDDSEEYRNCVVKKYEYMRHERNWPVAMGEEFTLWDLDHTIGSGLPAGSVIDRRDFRNPDPAPTWLEGTNSAAFNVSTGTSTSAGYEQAEIISTARPLPAGEYSFDIKERESVFKPCNYVVSNEVTVTVTARGALHELFFDPVTVGSNVAADSTNGVLNPASFTGANGSTTTISSLTWESSSTSSEPIPDSNGGSVGTVKVEVTAGSDPDDVLGDHILDFIKLDGSVSLSLDVVDAAVETGPASSTLIWGVSSQPWDSGDKLMVRIREAPPTPLHPAVVHNAVATVHADGYAAWCLFLLDMLPSVPLAYPLGASSPEMVDRSSAALQLDELTRA